MSSLPAVRAIVPTRDRPQLLAAALRGILGQDYEGDVTVTVVLDRAPADLVLPDEVRDPRITVINNERSPGLAGARNSGILAASEPWLAFCDDDDVWRPGKLRRQVSLAIERPTVDVVTCAIDVQFANTRTVRLVGADTVRHADLLPRRLAMLHSSTLLLRREALVARIGLISEDLPGSQNEDWDLLLRASAINDLANVDDPLVEVMWSDRSYFAADWDTKIASLTWMLDHHPDLASHDRGAARIYGQIGFWHAAAGERRDALRYAGQSLRRSPWEMRAYLAAAAACGLSPGWVLRTLHKRGRGI